MNIDLILPEDKRWQRFLDITGHDIYHLPDYCALEAEHYGGFPAAYYAEERDGERRFLLPFVIRSIPSTLVAGALYDAVSPYGYPGPLIHCEEREREAFTAAALFGLKRILAQKGIIALFVRFHPTLNVPLQPFRSMGVLVQNGESVSIDLTLPEEEVWKQIDPNHRRRIRRALSAGGEAYIDTRWEYFGEFEQFYFDTMHRHAANASYFFSRSYFERLKAILGDRLQLCIVRMGGQIVSAGLVTESGGIVQGYLNGTKAEFLQQSPTLLLYEGVRHWAKERGNRLFHLGSGVGGNHDTLFDFKARFSKLRHPFYTWRLVVNDTAYRAVISQWELATGHLAGDEMGFFPAYRNILTVAKTGGDVQ